MQAFATLGQQADFTSGGCVENAGAVGGDRGFQQLVWKPVLPDSSSPAGLSLMICPAFENSRASPVFDANETPVILCPLSPFQMPKLFTRFKAEGSAAVGDGNGCLTIFVEFKVGYGAQAHEGIIRLAIVMLTAERPSPRSSKHGKAVVWPRAEIAMAAGRRIRLR